MRISDWSSDVCSSDLAFAAARDRPPARRPAAAARHDRHNAPPPRRRRRLFVACGGRSWLVALAEPHLLFQPFKGQRRPMTAPSARIPAMDVLRGCAVMGILWMNIAAFALPEQAYFNPASAGPLSRSEEHQS